MDETLRAEELATIEVPEIERNYPEVTGISEIHIFLGPLNPDEETVAKYTAAVEEYNEQHFGKSVKNKMKAPYLCLSYREAGEVSVLQSSRYIYASNTDDVIRETYYDGKWFADRGFEVLRHKIECLASASGVPKTDEDAEAWPDRYFEFHIRVRSTESHDEVVEGAPEDDAHAMSPGELEALKTLAADFSTQFGTPVPLSYNRAKAGQRYMNVRFSGCGSDTARARVQEIVDAISQHTPSLVHEKTISEYVWADDNRAMDSGWIDF